MMSEKKELDIKLLTINTAKIEKVNKATVEICAI